MLVRCLIAIDDPVFLCRTACKGDGSVLPIRDLFESRPGTHSEVVKHLMEKYFSLSETRKLDYLDHQLDLLHLYFALFGGDVDKISMAFGQILENEQILEGQAEAERRMELFE